MFLEQVRLALIKSIQLMVSTTVKGNMQTPVLQNFHSKAFHETHEVDICYQTTTCQYLIYKVLTVLQALQKLG
jgi:hypothetical protein